MTKILQLIVIIIGIVIVIASLFDLIQPIESAYLMSLVIFNYIIINQIK